MNLQALVDPNQELKQEWLAFVNGESLAPSLLLRLLRFKYRHTKTVRLSPLIYTLYEEDNEATLYDQLKHNPPLPSHAIEVILVVHKYKAFDVTTIITRVASNRLLLFSNLASHLSANRDTLHLDQILINNNWVYGLDNGFFVFAFLDRLFQVGIPDDEVFFYDRKRSVPNPRTLAQQIVQELAHFENIKQSLISLYSEISRLLDQSDANRRLVEEAKQSLSKWIDCVLKDGHTVTLCQCPTTIGTTTVNFLAVDYYEASRDPIPSTAQSAPELMRELLAYLQFLYNATLVSVQIGQISIQAMGSDERFSVSEVREHILHLRYRLLRQIDTLNIPPVSSQLSQALSISQLDYERLNKERFITLPVMRHYLAPSLHPEILLWPGQNPNEPLKRFSFFLFESLSEPTPERHAFHSLLFVYLPPGLACQRTLYTPSLNRSEMFDSVKNGDALVKQLGLTCFRTQVDSHLLSEARDYFYTSWYSLMIIRALSERFFTLSPNTDWIGQVREIINEITLAQLRETYQLVLRETQNALLSAFFSSLTQPRELPAVVSRVSDLAKLSLSEQYIDDQIIIDVIHEIEFRGDCYSFDPTYWGVLARTKDPEIRQNRVFKRGTAKTVIMPINQKNYHWALAIIDLESKTVCYYSSLAQDTYYQNTFLPLMRSFMAIQAPTTLYKIKLLQGEVQAACSVDCALFILNKISQLCGASLEQQQRLYTRTLILQQLRARLAANLQQYWQALAEDLCERYLNPPPEEWLEKNQRKIYRERYLEQLGLILSQSKQYSSKSIERLKKELQELNGCQGTQEVLSLLENTLRARKRRENQEQEEEQFIRTALSPENLPSMNTQLLAFLQERLSVVDLQDLFALLDENQLSLSQADSEPVIKLVLAYLRSHRSERVKRVRLQRRKK